MRLPLTHHLERDFLIRLRPHSARFINSRAEAIFFDIYISELSSYSSKEPYPISKLPHRLLTVMTKGKGRSVHRGYKSGRSSTSVSRGPKKPPLTHFLCFPLVTSLSRPQLEQSLQQLRNAISNSPDTLNSTIPHITGDDSTKDDQKQLGAIHPPRPLLPVKAIRPIGTLHLTLGVMSLETDDRLNGAIDLLQSLKPHTLIEDALNESKKDANAAPKEARPDAPVPVSDVSSSTSEAAEVSLNTLERPISPPSLSRQPPTSLPEPDHKPIVVSLTSLTSMHIPTKTSILYTAPSDPTNRLLPLSQQLRNIFEENEYLVKDTRPLKLHATVVNTIYAKPGGRRGRAHRVVAQVSTPKLDDSEEIREHGDAIGDDAEDPEAPEENAQGEAELKSEDRSDAHGPNARAPIRFDATALIEQFKDYVWAKDFRVEKIAICKMGAKKILDTNGDVMGEEYEEVASIPLP